LNVESDAFHEPVRRTSADTVAGYLSAIAIFVSLVGIAWHPLRLILPAGAIALISSGMSNSCRQLTLAAVLICAVCLFLGLAVAVATSHPLW
jgi:predicted lysophospholipase L1 biosynthesis ABC-type transport system permease subunit